MREKGLSQVTLAQVGTQAQFGTQAQAGGFRLTAHGTTRFANPQEIGSLVAYLASARTGFIQGSISNIDGGVTRSL